MRALTDLFRGLARLLFAALCVAATMGEEAVMVVGSENKRTKEGRIDRDDDWI